jgi:hypothetical protein
MPESSVPETIEGVMQEKPGAAESLIFLQRLARYPGLAAAARVTKV